MSRKLRIILVEDNAIIAMDMAELLIDLGHDVCAIASSENGAVREAGIHHPDLMIVDEILAEGNGVSAMKRIASDANVPHLYLSGNAADIADQVPGALVVGKPFIMNELLLAIATVLDDDDPEAP